jgi:poly(ADP-ribose) glycohydrolase ARH3
VTRRDREQKVVDLRYKFLGSMIGVALGDAVGELAFHYRSEPVLRARVSRSTVLRYTDDTAMTIGLAESLTEVGRLDPPHLGDTFHANFRREPWRGYAAGPPTVFRRVERTGATYEQAARGLFGGQGSFGNGAAMRIAPVGLRYHDSADLYEMAARSAAVTHAHPMGVDGAAVLALAIARAVRLDPGGPFPLSSFCARLAAFARTRAIREKVRRAEELVLDGASPPSAARELGQSVAVQESMPFAICAFLRSPESFERCLLRATLHGGDRDTLGARACAVSGAYLGVERIPLEWRAKVENGATIESLATKLWAQAAYVAGGSAEV